MTAQAVAITFFISLAPVAIAALCGGCNVGINWLILISLLWSAVGLTVLAGIAIGVVS